MAHEKTLRLGLGDQLNEHHSWFRNRAGSIVYLLMEVRQDYPGVGPSSFLSEFEGAAAVRTFNDRLPAGYGYRNQFLAEYTGDINDLKRSVWLVRHVADAAASRAHQHRFTFFNRKNR